MIKQKTSLGEFVKGAVDDFFGGLDGTASPDLHTCPRQVTIAYREGVFNTWAVMKPFGSNVCKPSNTIQPVRRFFSLGSELQRLSLRGLGVELGVRGGDFTRELLGTWQMAKYYVQVDLWEDEDDDDDVALVGGTADLGNKTTDFMHQAIVAGQSMVQRGYAGGVCQCRDSTTACSEQFTDGSLDFVFVNTHDDRAGLIRDLTIYWQKLREGGVIAGRNYVLQSEPGPTPEEDLTLERDTAAGRVVGGAVDDFFGGLHGVAPDDLQRCPRQVAVTYREGKFNTWVVRK